MPQRFISLIICSAIVLGLGACGAKSTAGLLTVRGRVAVDGSKSMQPFNLKAETVFGNFTGDEDTSVETSGDSVALKRLCAGEIDIASVAREITAAESRACAKNGVDPSSTCSGSAGRRSITIVNWGTDCRRRPCRSSVRPNRRLHFSSLPHRSQGRPAIQGATTKSLSTHKARR